MEKLFKLKEHGTDVKTEIIAGITTFLAMAYILAVNPSYLGGIDRLMYLWYTIWECKGRSLVQKGNKKYRKYAIHDIF